MQFGNVNTRSIRNKTAEFLHHVLDSRLDVCTVTETWLNDHDTVSLALICQTNSLPMVSKSAEKAVVGQLFRHCSDNAPLPVHQSSYRQFHSTETALLKVQSDILSNMDKQEVTLLVLLDLSAAFDTVDHNILINILESDFGICGDVLKWFRSYLTGRVQRVIVNQQSSKTFDLNYGVPLASCLGPVLFLL